MLGFAHDASDDGTAQDLFEAAAHRLAHDDRSRLMLAGEADDGLGDGVVFQLDHLPAQITGQFMQFLQDFLFAQRLHGTGGAHEYDPKDATLPPGDLVAAPDKPGGLHRGGDADDDALLCAPGVFDTLLFHVGTQLLVNFFSRLPQCQLAQGGQVAGAKEVLQCGRHLGQRIHIAALQAVEQCRGGEVYQYHFVGVVND